MHSDRKFIDSEVIVAVEVLQTPDTENTYNFKHGDMTKRTICALNLLALAGMPT
jgi:hypothetical protein